MTKQSFVAAALLILGLMLAGCGPKLTAQTLKSIDQGNQQTAIATAQAKQKSAVDLAKEKAKATLSQANGYDNPIAHPVAATNNLVVEIRPWLIRITIISFVLWAALFGLSYTKFTLLNFLIPVFRWLAILSLAAVMTLPFLPLMFAAVAAAAIALLIYELFKDRWNIAEAIDDEEAIFDLKPLPAKPPATSTPTASPAATPAATSSTPAA